MDIQSSESSQRESAMAGQASTSEHEFKTPFTEAFKHAFLQPEGTKDYIWPDQPENTEIFAKEFGAVLELLLLSERKKFPPPPDGTDQFRDRVMQFLVDQEWPHGDNFPTTMDQEGGNLGEIWQICRELLTAVSSVGNGGQAATIPPH